ESESTTALEGDEPAGAPGIVEGSSAADGNAPQAGESFEETEAGWPDAPFEAVGDRAWAEPEREGSEPGDAPDADDLAPRQQPLEWPGLARESGDEGGALPQEAHDGRAETLDPTGPLAGWAGGEWAGASEAEGASSTEDP